MHGKAADEDAEPIRMSGAWWDKRFGLRPSERERLISELARRCMRARVEGCGRRDVATIQAYIGGSFSEYGVQPKSEMELMAEKIVGEFRKEDMQRLYSEELLREERRQRKQVKDLKRIAKTIGKIRKCGCWLTKQEIELLSYCVLRQIPQKPTESNWYEFYKCPQCQSAINIERVGYCNSCGQRLEWSWYKGE